MLCWLAVRDHMGLKNDIPTSAILIPAQGKPTTTERTDAVIHPSLRPLKEAQMLCWLTLRDHMALENDIPASAILIPARGKPTTPERTHVVIYPSLPSLKEARMLC